MAFGDYGQLTSITRKYVMPVVVDNIVKDLPLLGKLLDKGKRLSGGDQITVPVKYKFNTQGGSYAGLEVLDAAQEQTRVRAVFDWKQVYQPIVLSNIDLAKNGGEAKVVDLMKQEMEEAETDLKDKMATMLYSDGSGNSSKDFIGLKGNVDDGSFVTSIGGIVLATYTWFASSVTASIAELALSDLATSYVAAKSGVDSPDIIVTTESVWNDYESILQPQVRFASPDSLEGAAQVMTYKGVRVLADEYCTTGYLYMLNTKYLGFRTLKHPDFPTDARGFSMTDLVRPTSQDGKVGYILWYGELINTQPRRSSMMYGIT